MSDVDGPRRRFIEAGLVAAAAGVGLAACGSSASGGANGSSGPNPKATGGGTVSTHRYGDDPNQVGDLYLPAPAPGAGTGSKVPVVVLVHGGFWLDQYGRDLMVDLAGDIASRGWAAWNIEYRRVGQDGGGWPGTFADVAAAVDVVATLDRVSPALDTERVAVVGHSAGGQLAAWSAGRPGLPSSAPGDTAQVELMAVVSQAGVLDLVGAANEGVGGSAVPDLMGGGPDDEPRRYELGSPLAQVPIGVPVRCVHGRQDANVPFSQSERYVAAAKKSGDDATLAPFDGDHFDVLDPSNESWKGAADWLARRFAT